MDLLGLDIGSSSVKAAVLRNGRVLRTIVHAPFPSQPRGDRVEVDPAAILRAVAAAVKELGPAARRADVIGLAVMSPAWVAMNASGEPLTPIVTHQDRRSVEIARELENRVGRARYLRRAGNRPVPGGISVTTWAWYLKHEPDRLATIDLAGHLNTFLHRQITGARVIDPSNASFTGLWNTPGHGGWCQDLCAAAGISPRLLSEVRDANQIAGQVTPQAARRFGFQAGTPVMTGLVDTSAAMLLTGARAGQLLNVSGSTDVLALATAAPHPHPRLLTRALGVGTKWLSVSTLAAAGSSLNWAHDQFYRDLPAARFWRLVARLALRRDSTDSGIRFEPWLAGERVGIDQRRAAFTGLTLSSTREQLLAAVIESLARASAARLPLLRETGAPISRKVVLSGGVQNGLTELLHRDWPGRWNYRSEREATLRGLACLNPAEA